MVARLLRLKIGFVASAPGSGVGGVLGGLTPSAMAATRWSLGEPLDASDGRVGSEGTAAGLPSITHARR